MQKELHDTTQYCGIDTILWAMRFEIAMRMFPKTQSSIVSNAYSIPRGSPIFAAHPSNALVFAVCCDICDIHCFKTSLPPFSTWNRPQAHATLGIAKRRVDILCALFFSSLFCCTEQAQPVHIPLNNMLCSRNVVCLLRRRLFCVCVFLLVMSSQQHTCKHVYAPSMHSHTF